MAEISVLEVDLYGKPVGTLTLLPGDQTLFTFDQAYIDDSDRSLLSLSFKDASGGLITDLRLTRTRVPPFFSNLLPEGPLREYLAKRAGVNPKREFFLLRALGRDLPGAITIIPDEGELPPTKNEIKDRLDSSFRERMLRFSLAGVQMKFSALMEQAGGLTIPAEGVGGSWIVKLPSLKFDGVPENEFVMMELARSIGIDVPEVRLAPLTDITGLPEEIARLEGNALAVKRFDRTMEGEAIHIEDFAQVFGVYPEKKYERASYRNIAEVLWAETGEVGVMEFVRRLVFNALIGNADMHLKNWSLIYRGRRTPELAPGYDFVSTIAWMPDNKMALTLGRSKRMADLSLEQLSYFAAKAGLPKTMVLNTARETVARFLAVWKESAHYSGLPPKAVERIERHICTIALVNEVYTHHG